MDITVSVNHMAGDISTSKEVTFSGISDISGSSLVGLMRSVMEEFESLNEGQVGNPVSVVNNQAG